jgi:hypothetical protein
MATAAPRPSAAPLADLHVQDDSDGAVVDELDFHPRPEDPGLDGDATAAQRPAESLVERFRLFRRRCPAEARPVAFGEIGEEGELADHERLAADVEEAAVELPRLVLEDPKLRNLRRQPLGRSGILIPADAEQDHEAVPDLADGLAADADAGARDALEDGSQVSAARIRAE